MATHKHRGARLPHLGGKGSINAVGADAKSSFIGVSMPAEIEIRKEANIFSDYNLCALDSESLVATMASLATLSIGTMRLTATGLTSVGSLCQRDKSGIIASPSSVYDLSEAAP